MTPHLIRSAMLARAAASLSRVALPRAVRSGACIAPHRSMSTDKTSPPRRESSPQPPGGPAAAGGDTDAEAAATDDEDDLVNLLEDKKTRTVIHDAFAARARDAMRYDYFAQRAEVEADTDSAPLFRSLSETARQQALGYMELMEEYGDADFGPTMENLQLMATGERAAADGMIREAAVVAAEEGFEDVEEWFEDLVDAGHRAASRLEAVHTMLEEEEEMEADEQEADEHFNIKERTTS